MRYSQSLIARQYAQAYILQYGNQLTLSDIENMKFAVNFFRRHHDFMSLVGLIADKPDTKIDLVEEIFMHFCLHATLKNLVAVAKKHKRLILFGYMLQDICCLYGIKSNILYVTIQSATALESTEIEQFEKFFEKESGRQIMSRVEIKESLIAGVRVQSNLFLWEHSIAARLRKLRQKLMIEG